MTLKNAMPAPDPSRRRRPSQFSLGTLFLVTAVFSVLAAALGGMIRRQPVGTPMPPGFFILLAAAAPLGLVVLLGLLHSLIGWISRYRRSRASPPERPTPVEKRS